MIFIGNNLVSGNQLKSTTLTAEENEIIDRMSQYQERYLFLNDDHFQFVLHLRSAIIHASRSLFTSKAKFTTFETSHCNERFWRLTNQGGFKLKEGIRPSDAINDIFQNGVLYGFECATAMVIIYYKAVLDSINFAQFNRIYLGMYLRDWQSDDDLPIYTRRGNDYLPGDCLYFNNPQFNPKTPQWRGTNAMDLGNKLFFAHGIGIKTAEGILEALNKRRNPHATEFAYLLSQVTRLDDYYLYQFAKGAHKRSNTPILFQ
ncbi:protein-glutamine gamma-glutamyltransferase [Metabacillus bambusae]|uniref:Protein-glutamine gamma-glutamyltransferase n=1 Tax=Metabacillus bambusae TaxID=2795218 RepID=A0ABS3MXM5_9BACI|nr:protein-glutamine gamma-glutamyltransferase [Metabacillus bambusae]MBO1510782.1 protein-glutamine gamma-glutamyltransferase [Metabacillus bambusae]